MWFIAQIYYLNISGNEIKVMRNIEAFGLGHVDFAVKLVLRKMRN